MSQLLFWVFPLVILASACDEPPAAVTTSTGGNSYGSGGGAGFGAGGASAFDAGIDLSSDAEVRLQPDASSRVDPKQDFIINTDRPAFNAPVLARSGSALAMAYSDAHDLYVATSTDGSIEGLRSNPRLVARNSSPSALFEAPNGFLLVWQEEVAPVDASTTTFHTHLARLALDGSLVAPARELPELLGLDCRSASNGTQVLFACPDAFVCDVSGCGPKLAVPSCTYVYGINAVARKDHFDIVIACGSNGSPSAPETLQRLSVSPDGSSLSSPQTLFTELNTSIPNNVVPSFTPALADDGDKLWMVYGSPLTLSAFSEDGQQVGTSIHLDPQSTIPAPGIAKLLKTKLGWLVLDNAFGYGGCDGCSKPETYLLDVDATNGNAVRLTGDLAVFPPAWARDGSGAGGVLAWLIAGLGSSQTIGFSTTEPLLAEKSVAPASVFAELQSTLPLGATCTSDHCWVIGRELTSPTQEPQQQRLTWHTIDRASSSVSDMEIARVPTTNYVTASEPIDSNGSTLVVSSWDLSDPMQLVTAVPGHAGTSSTLSGNPMTSGVFLDNGVTRLFGRDQTGRELFARVEGNSIVKEYEFSQDSVYVNWLIECGSRYYFTETPEFSIDIPQTALAVYEPALAPKPTVLGHYQTSSITLLACNEHILTGFLDTGMEPQLAVFDSAGKTIALYAQSWNDGYVLGRAAANGRVYLLHMSLETQSFVLRVIDEAGNLTLQQLKFPAGATVDWIDCSSSLCSLEVGDDEVRFSWREGSNTRMTIWPLQ